MYRYRQEYPVKAMCGFFGVSRAAYYAWVQMQCQPDPDENRMRLVHEAYTASRQTYGYRRIRIWLQRERDVHLNHKTVLRLMRKLGIRSIARQRRVYWRRTGVKIHQTYPDLLQRTFEADRPNQKWVTDITYIQTLQGWAYLSTIKDLYDGFIIAHQVSAQNS